MSVPSLPPPPLPSSQTLCHFAKAASSADALALLCCLRLHQLSPGELAAATLYLQSNAAWVDRRLSTALAWRLLNCRLAADLALRGRDSRPVAGSPWSRALAPPGNEDAELGPRLASRRSLSYALLTAGLSSWTGTVMGCCARPIPCSWGPPRPMALQLEREEGGGSGAAVAGWDLQLSLDPAVFPAGFEVTAQLLACICTAAPWGLHPSFAGWPTELTAVHLHPPPPQATCFAFGADGFLWCALGPLAAPGPTWWKVGFLEQQLQRALPLTPLVGGSSCGGEGGLLLVGWWVPEQ